MNAVRVEQADESEPINTSLCRRKRRLLAQRPPCAGWACTPMCQRRPHVDCAYRQRRHHALRGDELALLEGVDKRVNKVAGQRYAAGPLIVSAAAMAAFGAIPLQEPTL
jgi:hypothetical protein